MSVLTFDEIVLQLRAQGVPQPMAEATARREVGAPVADVVDADALEDEHVAAGDKLVIACSGRVVRNSQKRASKITPGVPDRRYYFPRRGLKLWWEAKSETGKQSSAQRDFQELCDLCDDPYIVGTYDVLGAWLVEHELAVRVEGGYAPIPLEVTS